MEGGRGEGREGGRGGRGRSATNQVVSIEEGKREGGREGGREGRWV
jgi:hypothetical protein